MYEFSIIYKRQHVIYHYEMVILGKKICHRAQRKNLSLWEYFKMTRGLFWS